MGRNFVLNGFRESTERAGIGREAPNNDVMGRGVMQSNPMSRGVLTSGIASGCVERINGVGHDDGIRAAWFGPARAPASGVGKGVLVRERGGRSPHRTLPRIVLRATTRNTRKRSFHW